MDHAVLPLFEAVLAAKPDLIIMYSLAGLPDSKANYAALSKIVPTPAFDFDATDAGWRPALKKLGRVFGRTQTAERSIQTFDRRVTELRGKLAPVLARPNTALLVMFEPTSVMALGEKFSFSGTLRQLGLKLSVPAGMDANTVFKVVIPEALLTLKADRVVLLRAKTGGQLVPRNMTDTLLAQAKLPVNTYPLDPQEASTGPLTDLKRLEALAKILR
nr:ABC transporter substrate-binding protein [Deinococcus betulae]